MVLNQIKTTESKQTFKKNKNILTIKENNRAIIPKGSVQKITEKIDNPIQFGGGIGGTTTGPGL